MRSYVPVRVLLTIAAAGLLATSCYAPFTSQSAKCLDDGKVAYGAMLGLGSGYRDLYVAMPTASFRWGVAPGIEVSARTNIIWNYDLGFKLGIVQNENGVNLAVGGNAFYSNVGDEIKGRFIFRTPVYFSYNQKNVIGYGSINPTYEDSGMHWDMNLGIAGRIGEEQTWLFIEGKFNNAPRNTFVSQSRYGLYAGVSIGGF